MGESTTASMKVEAAIDCKEEMSKFVMIALSLHLKLEARSLRLNHKSFP